MEKNSALIMVDLQNDFCFGGSLAVPDGDEVVPLANQLQPYFNLVVATQDWHPANHLSFADNHLGAKPLDIKMINDFPQVLWPRHCVQNSHGAEFHPQLDQSRITQIFHKGVDPEIDSYSAFFDNAHAKATGLGDYLIAQKITDVYILGLATDYCVKFTCLDGVHIGFRVHLIEDACRGIELNPGDVANAIEEMCSVGVKLTTIEKITSANQLALAAN